MKKVVKFWQLTTTCETGDITKRQMLNLINCGLNKGNGIWMAYAKAPGHPAPKVTLLRKEIE